MVSETGYSNVLGGCRTVAQSVELCRTVAQLGGWAGLSIVRKCSQNGSENRQTETEGGIESFSQRLLPVFNTFVMVNYSQCSGMVFLVHKVSN